MTKLGCAMCSMNILLVLLVLHRSVRASSVDESISMYSNHPSIQVIRDDRSDRSVDRTFSFSPVSVSDVARKLKKLKSGKATGYDRIPAKLLRMGSDILSRFLPPL